MEVCSLTQIKRHAIDALKVLRTGFDITTPACSLNMYHQPNHSIKCQGPHLSFYHNRGYAECVEFRKRWRYILLCVNRISHFLWKNSALFWQAQKCSFSQSSAHSMTAYRTLATTFCLCLIRGGFQLRERPDLGASLTFPFLYDHQ